MARIGGLILTGVVLALAAPALAAASGQEVAAPPQMIARGVWLIPGGFPPKREPDGNSVVFQAPQGLIVLDTGRHPWHVRAIEAFAAERHASIAAIVNSHWHLDHTSGNAELKRAYPGARVYASRAIEGALKSFLPDSAIETRKYLDSGQVDPATAEDLRGDLAVIAAPAALIPDRPVEASHTLTVAGRRLRVNLAPNAATAGDVWLYDPATRTAAVGDLVTLPAPFLDTACPAGWKAALAAIWATPFRTLIPGHGPAMTRVQFGAWRGAFEGMVDCSATTRDKAACASDWVEGVRPLLDPGDLALKRARLMTEDYVELLRANGGKSRYCPT